MAKWTRLATAAAAVGFGGFAPSAATAQGDPVAMVRESERGREAYQAGKWEELADAAAKVTAWNPWQGEAWAGYGHAMITLGRPAEAIPALERALAIGHRPAQVQYNLACAHAKLGNTAEALSWLDRAIDAKFNDWALLKSDSDLDALRGEARFKELLGTPAERLSREQKWRHDLDFLAWRMERLHFDLYAKVSREKFRGDLEALKAAADSLSDAQLLLRLQKTLALVGDGHTHAQIAAEGSPAVAQRYPVAFFWFADGLFIRAAAVTHAELVGARVVAIGGVPVEEALRRAAEYVSRDNEMGVRQNAPLFLGLPPAMTDMGLCAADGRVSIGIERADGSRTDVTIGPGPGRWDGTISANAHAAASAPRYLARVDEPFGFEHIPEHRLVHVWLNQISNTQHETLAHFAGRLFDFIDQHGVTALALDVRNNGGGNNFLNKAIVQKVIRSDSINRKGHFFVITGRLTFSAAVNLVADLTRQTEAIIVGEPAGAGPNFVGESSIIELPCSGLRVSCSSLYWQNGSAQDYRTIIWPEIPAERTMRDFAENRDPAMDAIVSFLTAQPSTDAAAPAR